MTSSETPALFSHLADDQPVDYGSLAVPAQDSAERSPFSAPESPGER